EEAEARYATPAKLLWDALSVLGPWSIAPQYTVARVLLDLGRALPRVDGPPAAGHDVEERPPRSFAGWYRLQYGASPELHAATVLGAMGAERAVPAEQGAALLGLPAASLVEAEDGSVGPRNRHLVRADFTEETAARNAAEMWRILHDSGRLALIEAGLYGPYNDEEQRLIRVAFRKLSGGLDLAYFVRQAHEGSASELDRALAVAVHGEVDARTRLRNAVQREEDEEILTVLDELAPAERAEVL